MELISRNIYELAAKQEFDYVDKKTGELKKGHMLYLNDLGTGVQEQIFVQEEMYNKYRVKDKGNIVYTNTGKGIYFKGINLVKN